MKEYNIFNLKHGLVLLVITTEDGWTPYHIASHSTILLGAGLAETIEIKELDDKKYNDYDYYHRQNKDEIEVIFIPNKIFRD